MPSGAEMYRALRAQALSVTAADIGLAADEDVIGCVVDIGASGGWATVVCLSDGTTSLYVSGGGGIIGAGEQPGPRDANAALRLACQQDGLPWNKTEDVALPPDGVWLVRLLRRDGTSTSGPVLPMDGMMSGGPFDLVLSRVNDVVTQLRLIDEDRRE